MAGTPDRVIRVEFISFFSRRPDTVATCGETARHISRDVEQAERQMESLVQLRILRKEDDGAPPRYGYLPPVSADMRSGKA